MAKRPLAKNIDDQMLDATVNLAVQFGVSKITMLRVAEACGIAEITVYRHYDSKINLLNQAFLRINRQLAQIVYVEKPPEMDVGVHIRNRWYETFDFLVQHPNDVSFYNQYIHSPMYRRENDPRINGADVHLYRYALHGNPTISRLMEMGPEIVWTYTVQTMLIYAEKVAHGKIRDTAQVREYIFYLLFGGILSGLASRGALAE